MSSLSCILSTHQRILRCMLRARFATASCFLPAPPTIAPATTVILRSQRARFLHPKSTLTPTGPLNLQSRHQIRRMATSLPTSMKGVTIARTGGTEVLEYRTDLPLPELKDGHILVHNDCVGVNYIDTYFRTGLYPAASFPYTLGRDGEGTVAAVSPTAKVTFQPGDRVIWMADHGYAEYTAVPAERAIIIPSGVPPQTGVAALLQGLTALTMIRESYPVQRGDWILVHAAAGGTGLVLVQMLRAIGANIIGTASTSEKVELARKAGATHMINYSHEDVKTKVMELTSGKGVAAVFDGVGKATFDLSLDVLARKGTLVSFGNASGAVPPVTIARLTAKNAKLLRPTVMNYVVTREEFEHYSKELFGFIAKGELDINVHKVYPLSEVAKAHDDLEGRKTTGKLLLDPSK